jgi:transmembrane sensor
MKPFSDLARENRQALEEAASWMQRLKGDPSLELSPEFLSWVDAQKNTQALKAIEEGLMSLQALSASPELLQLRGKAIRSARRANAWRRSPHSVIYRVAASLLIIATISGVADYAIRGNGSVYETDIGVRKLVSLPDGSRVSLDSDTKLHVRYSDTARKVELDRGRARFDVAHDHTRPFTVTAGSQTVVAVGTSFTVEKLGAKVVVTLIQGRVVIKDAHVKEAVKAQQEPPVSLAAGEEFVASRDARNLVQPADVKAATAWEAGQLVFRNITLGEAVTQENRYTEKPIIVDSSIAQLRISGVFNAGDVVSFVSAVTSYLPVQASITAEDHIQLQRRL